MNENKDTAECEAVDMEQIESLSEIIMKSSQKTFDALSSEYTYYDENGCRLHNKVMELNSLEVLLHDVITKNVFKGVDYYAIRGLTPVWLRDAGHSQEQSISKEQFDSMVEYHDNAITHKFLYYHDCEMVMSAFQNRTCVIEHMMNAIFKYLSLRVHPPIEYNELVMSSGGGDVDLHTQINSLIITLASSFDLITKVAYELQHISEVNFDKYPKMKSIHVTYGDRVRLRDDLKVSETLFSKTEPVCIRQVLSLRDEIVHNGSLDFLYNTYHGSIDDKIDHFIFFPDMTESGVLMSHKARRKFYSDCNKTFNVVLPQLVNDVLECLRHTLQLLIDKFDCQWHENPEELLNYKEELLKWIKSSSILRFDESK